MEVTGEYVFDAPREKVWAYLQDPQVLVKVLPGCEELKQIGEDAYQGALKIKIGPVQGKFQGTVRMTNIVAPESYGLQVDGQGAPGFVKGGGGLRLEAQGDKTRIIYQGQAHVGGRIASVGQRLIDSSAKAIIRQSLDALNSMLQMGDGEQGTGDGNGEPETIQPPTSPSPNAGLPLGMAPAPPSPVVIPPGYAPPSQSQLALQVATDVAKDLIPARYYPVVAGAAGGALVLVFYLVLKQLFRGDRG